jgi:transcriptional regulator with XRE-family HTH domain
MQTMVRLSDRLKQLRKRADLSVTELAAAAGTNEAMIRRWEAGDHTPSLQSVQHLCEALDVSVEEFVKGCDFEMGHYGKRKAVAI